MQLFISCGLLLAGCFLAVIYFVATKNEDEAREAANKGEWD